MPVSVELKENRYGKSRVRLVQVERHGPRHDLNDLSVDVQLWGAFDAAYTLGDNSRLIATDTMKNTVYVLARQEPVGEIEEFGARLAEHFLSRNEHVSRARIAITQNLWERIPYEDRGHDHSFQLSGPERRTAVIDRDRASTSLQAGIIDLTVLKTTNSAFEGFLRDELTTLKETSDRLFGTVVKAEWSYKSSAKFFADVWSGVRSALLEVFASHDSRGVQHTLHAMGEAVLDRFDSIDEIHLSMPNRHCLLVDLAPFQMDNPNEVFVPTDEPHGLIEATLRRSDS